MRQLACEAAITESTPHASRARRPLSVPVLLAVVHNPYNASRMLTRWFQIMLDEAEGNVDLAIRAYNAGIGRAQLGEGDKYLEGVKRRWRRYIRNEGDSRAWRF
jgi:hypothetical protein